MFSFNREKTFALVVVVVQITACAPFKQLFILSFVITLISNDEYHDRLFKFCLAFEICVKTRIILSYYVNGN